MNARERFARCNRFETVDQASFTEIAAWGQATERWLSEGMPKDVDTNFNTLEGNAYYGFERWEFMPLNVGMVPAFEHEVTEEDERIIVFRGADGILHRALKEGQAKSGTRASMDQYLRSPVETRADFQEMRKRYDPHDPARYPANWDDLVEAWKTRDYPLLVFCTFSARLEGQDHM